MISNNNNSYDLLLYQYGPLCNVDCVLKFNVRMTYCHVGIFDTLSYKYYKYFVQAKKAQWEEILLKILKGRKLL